MSTFNPDQFLGTSTEEVGSTKYVVVPEGERIGQVSKVEGRQFDGKDGRTHTILELTWMFTGEDIQKEMNQDSGYARQTLFLDLKADGSLDFGTNKNVQLSRLREAVGQLRSGKPWNPNHLMGATAMCMIVHGTDQNGDPRAEVKRVASASAARGATTEAPRRGRAA